jgi:hypothetical protein
MLLMKAPLGVASITLNRRQKSQSVEWHHPHSPPPKKFKATPLAGKVMAFFLGGGGGAEKGILVSITPRGQTINSALYIQTLKTFQKPFSIFRLHKNVAEVFLQHDNA